MWVVTKFLEKIGKGGMGIVYKAEQQNTNRIVALKILSKNLTSKKESLARFIREGQAAAALNHPNIVQAYEAGHVDQLYFLAMEYISGQDLRKWLKDFAPLPIDWACESIRQASLGLQHAHEKGVIHRDIKPGNILVSSSGVYSTPQVKVLDMGLARFIQSTETSHELTRTGQVIGTVDYMAPEQAFSIKNADIRSDIYGLGCTLYRLITGEVPFTGAGIMEKLLARTTSDPKPMKTLRPEVPDELDKIVMRMLSRDPEFRHQIPNEVAHSLAPFSKMSLEDGSSISSLGSISSEVKTEDRSRILDQRAEMLDQKSKEMEVRERELEEFQAELKRKLEDLHHREEALAGFIEQEKTINLAMSEHRGRVQEVDRQISEFETFRDDTIALQAKLKVMQGQLEQREFELEPVKKELAVKITELKTKESTVEKTYKRLLSQKKALDARTVDLNERADELENQQQWINQRQEELSRQFANTDSEITSNNPNSEQKP